ncbi:cation:proton antiporter [Microbacterium sp. BWT-B31]|uniref:cation:proton antiporter n=1 Tax=Microbacterium sp. BWT-B31 TaxID=3232072 RepID=UPI0035288155
MDEDAVALIELGILLFGIGLLGRLSSRLGISPIPLILIGGLAFGEGGIFPFSAGGEFIEIGAEIGVILLLVMLGLEYNASELVGNLRTSKTAGFLDMVLNAVPGAAIALLLGWGPISAVVMAGITWASSSGVIAKMLQDLGRLSNRETPVVLAILVIEDLAMAFYLPIMVALLLHMDLARGTAAVLIALVAVLVILFVALRHGRLVSKLVWSKEAEVLLLSALGLTLLVAGIAAQANVSAAVGAFLVGIAISGPAAEHAERVLTPLRDLFASVFFLFFGLSTDPADLVPMLIPAVVLGVVTTATKILTGYLSARKAGIGEAGRWRAGFALVPRGEFSIVIAGLAVSTGLNGSLAALATAYVFITIIVGPFLARIPDAKGFTAWTRRVQAARNARARAAAS